MKKQKIRGSAPAPVKDEDKQSKEQKTDENEKSEKSPKQIPMQYKKGQKAKLKKIKEKYGWQDEEDRKLNMELLGHGENQKKGRKAKVKLEREQFQEKREITKAHQKRQLDQEKEEEEIRTLLREEKLEGLTEEDKKRIEELTAKNLGVNLTALTGKPFPTDNLLYAIPVCAPYDTLRDYKYKVKLVPGNEKKGRALSLCMDIFMRTEGSTEREKELIKVIPESEWSLTLISNCKLAAAGLIPKKKGGKGGKKK